MSRPPGNWRRNDWRSSKEAAGTHTVEHSSVTLTAPAVVRSMCKVVRPVSVDPRTSYLTTQGILETKKTFFFDYLALGAVPNQFLTQSFDLVDPRRLIRARLIFAMIAFSKLLSFVREVENKQSQSNFCFKAIVKFTTQQQQCRSWTQPL